jgi:hypothetical protein
MLAADVKRGATKILPGADLSLEIESQIVYHKKKVLGGGLP